MAKGRSLHIGVNVLDPAQYLFKEYGGRKNKIFAHVDGRLTEIEAERYEIGWKGTLGDPGEACEKDATDMAKLAADRGFDAKVLLSEEATSTRVRDEILAARSELQPGDIFLITYSGHGCHVKDRNKDELDDEHDETWCLYDRMLLDDEQQELYGGFMPGVRVLALLDSCHSGTGTRSAHKSKTLRGTLEARSAPREVDDAIYLYGLNKKRYDDIQDEIGIGKPNPYVISISACQDTQQAWGDEEGGVFTNAVKAILAKGEFDGNYLQFYERIKTELPHDPDAQQDPHMDHSLPRGLAKALRERPDDAEQVQAELMQAIEKRPEQESDLRGLMSFASERPLEIDPGRD